jgi:hypothetical protein
MSEDTNIRCIVTGPDAGKLTHVPTIVVNGREASFALDTEISLPEWAVEALDNSVGYDVTRLPVSPPVTGDGDGTVSEPGGFVDGADTFDADAIISGNLDEVKAKLAGLSAEHLDLVAAAETDREAPRKGVAAMIEEAKAALAGGE